MKHQKNKIKKEIGMKILTPSIHRFRKCTTYKSSLGKPGNLKTKR